MNAIAAMAPSTPTLAKIIAPAMEACAAPARNSTALSSIQTTMEGGLIRRTTLEDSLLTVCFPPLVETRKAPGLSAPAARSSFSAASLD